MIVITIDTEPDLHGSDYKGIYQGIPLLLKILDKYEIKATFFVTCDCIENYPKIFQNLQKQGHEIALHGYRHIRFDDLTYNEKEQEIQKSLAVFKKYLRIKPKGFRAPQHSIDSDTLNLLTKYDFKYDSSQTPLNALQFLFFPRKFPLNFKSFFSKPYKHYSKGLLEIPSTAFFIPFVSLVFRAFPKNLQKIYFFILRLFFNEFLFYAHSWDFIELPNSRLDRKFPHTKFIKNLDNFISQRKKQGHKFLKVEDLL